jgi:hypothetical protein
MNDILTGAKIVRHLKVVTLDGSEVPEDAERSYGSDAAKDADRFLRA